MAAIRLTRASRSTKTKPVVTEDSNIIEDLKSGQTNLELNPVIEVPNDKDDSIDIVEIDHPSDNKPTKRRGRPKGSKNGAAAKKSKPVKIKAASPPKIDKNKIVRVSKHLTSVKDKLVRIYGENKDKLLGLAVQKEKFETAVFDFDESQLTKFELPFESIASCIELANFSTVSISQNELNEIVPLDKEEIKFDIGSNHFSALTDETVDLPVFNFGVRQGLVFNTGGFISDMAWTKIPDSDTQYLAVSVSNDRDAADPDLRLSGKPVPHPAVIKIYEMNTATGKAVLFYQLAHDCGVSWDLKWHPGFIGDSIHIGLLAGVFQDGTIKFLSVKKAFSGQIHHLQSPAFSIDGLESDITSFDFRSSNEIVCGFQNGYYGEFSLSDNKYYTYKQIFESYVISTVVLRSNFENTLVCMSSIDGNCCLFDPKDIRLTKCFATRTRGSNTLPLIYVPQLYTVVRTDSLSSIKAFTPRAIFVDHNICQHDNTVVSIGSSSLHPMLLSGSSDGAVVLNNLVRRMLQGLKNNTDIYRYIRLWKWDYNESSGHYRLNPQYKVFKFSNTETSNVKLDYPGINIQSVKWIEDSKCGKYYSFANAAGFVVIEKLGK
ncbi:unnamed protein product [Kluyveromyces dobzhanskii CBS 2104]|uniref:WGS project CCBQ000000000 data, contig 00011 n=1 Tax=Kluyveromyces dobzhanskii CBS 2104 TaxID=1427455 RepID=A0A0A8L9Z8_9SACH|nr:unnamed protein product [Kluyveromyces dobzhanskii CBS 2104]